MDTDNSDRLLGLMVGIIIGMLITISIISIRQQINPLPIETTKRIEPKLVITTKDGLTDTLFIYSK